MMELPFMDKVLNEERQLMKWVGMFPVGIFREGIFRGEFYRGQFDRWEFSGGILPWGTFPEPILISNLAESVIMTNILNLV